MRGSDRMGTAVISGATFANKSVVYYDVQGVAIVEGDIAIGYVADIERQTVAARDATAMDPNVAFAVAITGSQFRWPNCIVPYEIDPALPNQQRVTDAIAHWVANTALRFPLRTAANQGQYPNYIRFSDQGGCWSLLGMQGGQQTISLGSGCSTGNAIHEIGHAVGLWHEQSREDRDLFVTIQWANIQSGMAAQFNQHIADGDDIGTYDYGSIMHYPRDAFSRNGLDTIVPTDPSAVIGQRNGLSPGDIAAIAALYPNCRVMKPVWADPIPKIFRDPQRFKKIVDEPIPKHFRDPKVLLDPKGIRDPGPKPGFDPLPPWRGGLVTRPGTLQPFATATPHHAAVSAYAGASHFGAQAGELDPGALQQVLDLDAAIAEAQAQAARSQAEISRMQQLREELVAAASGGGTCGHCGK